MHHRVFRFHLPIFAIVLIFIPLLQGCPPSTQAVITYDQAGACLGLGDPLKGFGTGGLAYVYFHLTGIDNSKTGITFNFIPTNLYPNIGGLTHEYALSETPQWASDLGYTSIKYHSVPAGTNLANLNEYVAFVVETNNSNALIEANNTNYFLLYKRQNSDPGVLLTKINDHQTSWPLTPDCHGISFIK